MTVTALQRWLQPGEREVAGLQFRRAGRRILTTLAWLPWAAAFGPAAGAADPLADSGLIALPGKRPLIKRTFRPPNFETPPVALRDAFTANDAFFVRYHLAVIPDTAAPDWRLRVGGASAPRTLQPT